MKLFVCTLLLLAINGLNCAPMESEESEFEERKYGLGIDVGGAYKVDLELGVHGKNGTYSKFGASSGKARANTGIGVYKTYRHSPTRSPPKYIYPVQNDPRFLVPQYNPYMQYQSYIPNYPVAIQQYQPYDPRYPVPINIYPPQGQYYGVPPGYPDQAVEDQETTKKY